MQRIDDTRRADLAARASTEVGRTLESADRPYRGATRSCRPLTGRRNRGTPSSRSWTEPIAIGKIIIDSDDFH